MGSKIKRNVIKSLWMICGVLLILAGCWLRIKTWGIQMLYVHTLLGKFYWFCYIFWLMGIICIVVGIHKGKRKTGEELSDVPEKLDESKKQEQPVIQEKSIETKETKAFICPHCKTELSEEAVFCKNCGKRIKDEEKQEEEN